MAYFVTFPIRSVNLIFNVKGGALVILPSKLIPYEVALSLQIKETSKIVFN